MGTRHSTRKGMPRKRNGRNYGGLASYFYDAQGDGLAPLPQSRVTIKQTQAKGEKASFLSHWENGIWKGEGPAPPGGPPKRRHRSQSRGPGERSRSASVPRPHVKKPRPEGHVPAEMGENQERHMHKEVMNKSAAEMKKYFGEADDIYTEHPKWLLFETHVTINEHIAQCKSVIADVRLKHKGPGKHKEKVESVHATEIDITHWKCKQIHEELVYQSGTHKVDNRLLLERPYDPQDSHHVYVNVALAWLFAAKRQLMTILEADVKRIPSRTPKMDEFIAACEKGRQARKHYHDHKTALGVKHHSGSYTLNDKHYLEYQRDRMFGDH